MNEKDTDSKQHYDFLLALDKPGDAHAIQFELIPANTKVLDVGCHTGILGEVLKQQKGCAIVGIDHDNKAIEQASKKLDRAFVVDLERLEWAADLLSQGQNDFDVILFGDVLEHTRNPQAILRQAASLLKQGGRVIVSIPNVANLRVRLGLLFGNFNYQESGILDRTHLRFFTRQTARQLVEQAGYRILETRVTRYGLPYWLIQLFPGLLGVQFIIAATPQKE